MMKFIFQSCTAAEVLMNEGQKSRQPGSLLIAALGMGQMVTTVQPLGRKAMEDGSFSTLAEEQDPDVPID